MGGRIERKGWGLILYTKNTKEDISSLPVPYAKFQEAKSDYLIVTLEMVAKTIKAMNNKSSGVDGSPPKLLMETVGTN